MSQSNEAQQKNAAGRDAFAEALFAGEGKEEVAGWIEGFLWRVEGGEAEEGTGKIHEDQESLYEEEDGILKHAGGVTDDLATRTEGIRIDEA